MSQTDEHQPSRIPLRSLTIGLVCFLLGWGILVWLHAPDPAISRVAKLANEICQAIVDGRHDRLHHLLRGDSYHVKWLSRHKDMLGSGYDVRVRANGDDIQLLDKRDVTYVATVSAGDARQLRLSLGFRYEPDGDIRFVVAAISDTPVPLRK